MGAKSQNSSGGSIVEINVIPLVDIILVVLIIFMVAAPLVMQPKVDINLPKAAEAKEEKNDKKPLRITMTKDGAIFINQNPATIEGIVSEAQKRVSKDAETSALLVADKDVTLEMVTELVDAVKGGGIKKVAFSIQKK